MTDLTKNNFDLTKNNFANFFGKDDIYFSSGVDYGICFLKRDLEIISDLGIYCNPDDIFFKEINLYFGYVLRIKGGIIVKKESFKDYDFTYADTTKNSNIHPLILKKLGSIDGWGMPLQPLASNFETFFFLDHKGNLIAKVVEYLAFGLSAFATVDKNIPSWEKFFCARDDISNFPEIIQKIKSDRLIDFFLDEKIDFTSWMEKKWGNIIYYKKQIILLENKLREEYEKNNYIVSGSVEQRIKVL